MESQLFPVGCAGLAVAMWGANYGALVVGAIFGFGMCWCAVFGPPDEN